jgi:hypothetical protein
VRLTDYCASFVRADIRLRDLEPYRRAGSDAYDLIDQVPTHSWARLAAWNAFVLQVYADCLVAAGSNSRYVTVDIAVFARAAYAWANVWVIEVRKALASDRYRFQFVLPHPLPHWGDRVFTDARLEGMYETLETVRTRAASDLDDFQGDGSKLDLLRIRLAQLDAESEYIGRLWTPKPTLELRGTLGDQLMVSLDRAFELGHLLAQPSLLDGVPAGRVP